MPSSATLIRWILPASLACNVFLGAALLVHLRPDWWRRPPPPPDRMLEEMIRDLPSTDAALLRQALAGSIRELGAAHQAERDLPGQLQAILRQEPFDKQAFKDRLDQSLRARAALDDALPEAIARISPEARRKLADWRPPPPPDDPPR